MKCDYCKDECEPIEFAGGRVCITCWQWFTSRDKKPQFKREPKVKQPPICQRCQKVFTPTGGNQKYCGTYKLKTGCSYERHLFRVRMNMRQYHRNKWLKNMQVRQPVTS